MTKLLVFILITFLAAEAANAKGYEVKTDRRTSVAGDNNIEIQVKESEGGSNISTGNHRLPGVS